VHADVNTRTDVHHVFVRVYFGTSALLSSVQLAALRRASGVQALRCSAASDVVVLCVWTDPWLDTFHIGMTCWDNLAL
jgi:hypothetical protein